jgi:hypothetical protein
MPALVMTAAEIAAAEALAAEILIAQQATAATAATAEAVQVANAAQATQATTQAAQAAQATTQAAQATQATQASASGLQALAQEVGTTVQPTGLETLTQAPLQATTPASELEQIRQAASGAQNQQIVDAKNFPGSATNPLTTPPVASSIPPAPNIVPPGAEYIPPSNFGSAGQSSMLNSSATLTLAKAAEPILEKAVLDKHVFCSLRRRPGTGYQGNVIQIGGETNATPYTEAELTMPIKAKAKAVDFKGCLIKAWPTRKNTL